MVAFSHQSVWMFHVTRFHRGLTFHTFDRHCKATPHSVKPICLSCNFDPKTFLTKRIIKITWWQLYHGVGVWGIEGRRQPDQLPGLTSFFSKTHQNSNFTLSIIIIVVRGWRGWWSTSWRSSVKSRLRFHRRRALPPSSSPASVTWGKCLSQSFWSNWMK